MTNVELARRAGISAPPCLRRVRALEEAGYHPRLSRRHQRRGAGLRRHRVRPGRAVAARPKPICKAFETLVQSWPEVRECHMLAGETDFLLRIVAVDWDAYQRFLTTRLTAAPNVTHVKSALAHPHLQERAGRADRAMRRRRGLLERDLHDLVGLRAARRGRPRRCRRPVLPISARASGEVIESRFLLDVGLVLADDLIGCLLVGVLVDQR